MTALSQAFYEPIDDDITRKIEGVCHNEEKSRETTDEHGGGDIESFLTQRLSFTILCIPSGESLHNASILVSKDWTAATKLLMIINNGVGASLGIFSRLDIGIAQESAIPFVKRALDDGYGVLILRTKAYSAVDTDKNSQTDVIAISGSETPKVHVLYVYENIFPLARKAEHVALLSYGQGASLCKELLLSEVSRKDPRRQTIKAFLSIEATSIVKDSDPIELKCLIKRIAINLECNLAPRGYRLMHRLQSLGCVSLSLGLPHEQLEVQSVDSVVGLAMDPVIQYLRISEMCENPSSAFAVALALDNSVDPLNAEIFMESLSANVSKSREEVDVSVEDFDLLTVVGKGAFGKVCHYLIV